MKANVVTLIGTIALLAACSESTAPAGDAPQVSLSFTTRAASGSRPLVAVANATKS